MRQRASIVAIRIIVITVTLTATIAIAAAGIPGVRTNSGTTVEADQVCNPTADYFLGMEDYRAAIGSHLRVVAASPSDALAHYHLGFAYGMTGDRVREVAEYRRAAALGLHQWDLYLNLGRALLERGDLNGATDALNMAASLEPQRPEPHFNLGLVYERRGLFPAALTQLRTSLRLDSQQPDARNMIGLIYAEEHDYPRARQIWSELARSKPDFEPARLNLAILNRVTQTPETHPSGRRNALRTAFVPQ